MTHTSLFSGLGVWTLAAAELGIETVLHCEIDGRCQQFLRSAWPGIPIVSDAKNTNELERAAGVDILSAGVPCQPASRAGDQRGTQDDRWLWDSTLAAIQRLRPRAVILEQPPGILDLVEHRTSLKVDANGCAVGNIGTVSDREGASVFHGILESLEEIGYEIPPILDIPACGLDAPHIRHRLYIVAFAKPECGGRRDDQSQRIPASYLKHWPKKNVKTRSKASPTAI